MVAGAIFSASGTMNPKFYQMNSMQHCQDLCLWSESHGNLGYVARLEHTIIPPENRERERRTKLNSEDQSQTPGFYSEGYSKCWNTEYSKRVRSIYMPLQKTAEFQTQTTGKPSHDWCSTHGKLGGNLRVPSTLFKPVIHTAKLYQSPTSVLKWYFMTAG